MATINELRESSRRTFTELLAAQEPGSEASPLPRGAPRFTWFAAQQATDSALLALRLSAAAASKKGAAAGLRAALDAVDEERSSNDPELVRQGFALFVTHNERGRTLLKPRTVRAAPGLFSAPAVKRRGKALSIGGLAPTLDYWREDMLANEHHQHWHEVYPFTGRPPTSFDQWVGQVSDADKIRLLRVIRPGVDWASRIPGASAAQVAAWFAQALDQQGRSRLISNFFGDPAPGDEQLPRSLLRKILILNDRHGELFLYMHRQMLARYDAELLSHQLARVQPFKPAAWSRPIPEGYDPEGLQSGQRPFTIRRVDRALPSEWAQALRSFQTQIDQALGDGAVPSIDGLDPPRPVDANSLGEFVEEQLHNTGHGMIGALSEPIPAGRPGAGNPNGVMNNPMAAIRDQVFWRWHKQIDDIGAKWQDTLAPASFADAPPVLVRDVLTGAAKPWASPDIVLVRTSDLPGRSDVELQQLGEQLFGGDHWDTDFTAASARAGTTSLTTLGELSTFTDTATLPNGRTIKFLSHEPFTYFVRAENTVDRAVDVTVRIFLAPASVAQDRRAWIEMDKFTATLPAASHTVLHRSDRDSAVIKRPAETTPATSDSGPAGSEQSYCDCGWPYTLLLPRGTAGAGMQCRLLVMLTDATLDRITEPGHCGSMSFCGARDRYPDAREMGYPFARPFAGPKASAIRDFVLAQPHVAARTIAIRNTS